MNTARVFQWPLHPVMCERWLKMFHEDNNMWIIINNNKCRSFFSFKLSKLKTGWFWFGDSLSLNDHFEKKRKKNNLVYRFSKQEPSASQTL